MLILVYGRKVRDLSWASLTLHYIRQYYTVCKQKAVTDFLLNIVR